MNMWDTVDVPLLVHKFTLLCGIVSTAEIKEKLNNNPRCFFSDVDIVDFVPRTKYPAVLDFQIGVYWLKKVWTILTKY